MLSFALTSTFRPLSFLEDLNHMFHPTHLKGILRDALKETLEETLKDTSETVVVHFPKKVDSLGGVLMDFSVDFDAEP